VRKKPKKYKLHNTTSKSKKKERAGNLCEKGEYSRGKGGKGDENRGGVLKAGIKFQNYNGEYRFI